jgi:hypothetical protein
MFQRDQRKRLAQFDPHKPQKEGPKISSGWGRFWGVRSLYFLYFRRLTPHLGFNFLRNPPFMSNSLARYENGVLR